MRGQETGGHHPRPALRGNAEQVRTIRTVKVPQQVPEVAETVEDGPEAGEPRPDTTGEERKARLWAHRGRAACGGAFLEDRSESCHSTSEESLP